MQCWSYLASFGSVGRDLDWPGCVNVRDLGGLAAADGTVTVFRSIVRADNVRRLTARGWDEAREYGIRTVLDLRSDCERVDDASVPPDLRKPPSAVEEFFQFKGAEQKHRDLKNNLVFVAADDRGIPNMRDLVRRHSHRCVR